MSAIAVYVKLNIPMESGDDDYVDALIRDHVFAEYRDEWQVDDVGGDGIELSRAYNLTIYDENAVAKESAAMAIAELRRHNLAWIKVWANDKDMPTYSKYWP